MPLPHKRNFLRDVLPKNSDSSPVTVKKIKESGDLIYHKIADPIMDYKKGDGKWRIWLAAGLAVLALAFAMLHVFSKAVLTVTPRIDESKFVSDLKAKLDTEADFNKGELGYRLIPVEKIGGKDLDADGERVVDRKASGTIIIYNKYSDKTQKLIRNTRFETPGGLIFRIDRSVVIPGRTTVDGKIVPGSVEAVVYADEPGIKYNIGLTDFSIPGFKSDPSRFSGFYARSKTPMLDGFSGKEKYVSDAKQKLARAEIRAVVEKEILAETVAGLADDEFVPKGAYTVEFESLPSQSGLGGKVSIKEKARLSIYVFKKDLWDKYLGNNSSFATAIASSTIAVENRNSLDFIWKSRPSGDNSEIIFRIDGAARFIWKIDERALKASLAGQKKKNLEGLLKQYGEIMSATATLSPVWRTSFPNDPDKIKIVISIPQ